MKIYENLDINDLDGEIWKVIQDFPDYCVSNLGRIKSFKKCRGINQKILKLCKNKIEYLFIRLSQNKKIKNKNVHILVYETFYNDKLKLNECIHHKDENKQNNYYENLEKMTKFDHNSFHHKGENNSSYKLTNQQIISIKIDIEKGDLTKIKISEKYKVSTATIWRIQMGKRQLIK